ELVLKNVIHQDEVMTTPSRDMRGVVLTTLGIAGATALASETANAATAVSATKATFVKTMFASKLNALVTASMVTASALGGYAVRTIVADRPATHSATSPIIRNSQPAIIAPAEVASPVENTATTPSLESAPKQIAIRHKASQKSSIVEKPDHTAPTLSGSAPAEVKAADIQPTKK
ncbi:MAG: hypothetical protein ABI778_10530, partial [Ignavibacteriota bacterium]